MFVFLDTPFDPDYPVYTRANAGEILPHPLTPLCWSVIGPAFEEGFRISFCDDFGLMPRPGPGTPFQMTGRLAARLHLNLSVLRTTAERLPGTSAAVVDVQYFGDAASTGLPDHRPHPDDRRFKLKSPSSVGRTLAGIGRRVDRDRAAVDDLRTETDELLHSTVPDAVLVRARRRSGERFGQVLGTHVTARALTSPLLEQASNALVRAGIDLEDALAYVSEIPDLESAKPSWALAAIARSIPAASELAALVARGSLGEIADSPVDGAEELHRALRAFLDSFGHRGVGEFDPTLPVWEQRPDDVVVLLSRIGPDRVEVHREFDVDPGRMARPIVAAARSAVSRAERTKDNTMRATNQMRRLLVELRRRWSDTIDDRHLLQCTLDEIEAAAHGAGFPTDGELERRAAHFAEAEDTEVSEWSDGSLRLLLENGPAPSVHSDELQGIPGSSGIATGRARVISDPYADFDDGDILVASMTDTAWTPLFLVAGAVVTDVGGVLSHATIVARDLGIPAVVNTKHATTRIRTGDLVRVDGTAGTVTVTDRA